MNAPLNDDTIRSLEHIRVMTQNERRNWCLTLYRNGYMLGRPIILTEKTHGEADKEAETMSSRLRADDYTLNPE